MEERALEGWLRKKMEDKMESQEEQKEEGKFCNYFTHESKSRRSNERRKWTLTSELKE